MSAVRTPSITSSWPTIILETSALMVWKVSMKAFASSRAALASLELMVQERNRSQ